MSRPALSSNPNDRRTVLFICLGLALLTLAVFGQTFHYGFIDYDDNIYVFENPMVSSGLTQQGIVSAFSHAQYDNWVPLTTISHMLDCQIYGLNAGGHHLTNVLLHTASVILLFLALWQMTAAIWRNAFVAAVFAIHPLHVESVAWVSERKDTLSGFFFMLMLWAYVRYARRASSVPRYLLVLLLFALGLMSKPMLVTVPFVLLLLDYWPLKRFSDIESVQWLKKFSVPTRLILEKVPLVVVCAIFCILTVFIQNRVQATSSLNELPASIRASNSLSSCITYIWRSFHPVGLAVYYPYPRHILPLWNTIGAFIVLAAITIAVFLGRRKYPCLGVGWLWYLGMLVPVIGLVQVGTQASADRYTYLPQIGLGLMVIFGAADLLAGWRYQRALSGSFAGGAIALLAFFAHRQASYWKNNETVWAHAVAVTSNNSLAHLNLGVALYKKGQVNEAINEYQKAMAIDPGDASVYYDLGNALVQKGRMDEAIMDYQRSLAINSNDPVPHIDLGYALVHQGKVDEAILQFQQAVQINPNNLDARNNLAGALLQKGQLDQAIVQYQQILQKNPNDADARNNLGQALHQKGDLEGAIAQFQQALQIKPGDTGACNNLGNALMEKGDLDEALAQFQQVLKIDPANEPGHYNLGNALLKKGDLNDAIVEFQQAVQLKPDDAAAQGNLGMGLYQEGKMDEGILHLQQALKIDPNNVDADNGLGSALLQQGKADEAIALFQQAVKIDPGNAITRNNLGNAFLRKGAVDDAITQFQEGVQISPNQAVIHNNLGNAFLQKREMDEAIAQYQQAVGINPDYLKAHDSLGVALLQVGKTNEAIVHFQKVLSLAQAMGRQDIVNQISAGLKSLGAQPSAQ